MSRQIALERYDILTARLKQADAGLAVLMQAYDDDRAAFTVAPDPMLHHLWGIRELLTQALAATQ